MRTVLVIDDEPVLRDLMVEILAGEGHHAVGAGDARAALELLAEERVGLVVGDIVMPGLSGLELLERLRAVAGRALARKNAELDAFAYSASHDLKAPLASIQGFAGSLERHAGPALDEHARHCLERIHASAGRLQRLITDLLAFARADAEAAAAGPVDADRVVRDVVAELRARTTGRATTEVATAIPPLRAHEAPRRQALGNLLENALAYGAGRVVVGARLNGHVELWVEDDGPGVPEGERARLVDLFARGRLARDAASDGSGIGLALVKKIAYRFEPNVPRPVAEAA